MNEDIINLFGAYLAEIINKPSLACKGLVRFVIRDYYKDKKEEEWINFSHLDSIFTQGLKKCLLHAQIPNVDQIIPSLQQKLLEQQAIFTMNK